MIFAVTEENDCLILASPKLRHQVVAQLGLGMFALARQQLGRHRQRAANIGATHRNILGFQVGQIRTYYITIASQRALNERDSGKRHQRHPPAGQLAQQRVDFEHRALQATGHNILYEHRLTGIDHQRHIDPRVAHLGLAHAVVRPHHRQDQQQERETPQENPRRLPLRRKARDQCGHNLAGAQLLQPLQPAGGLHRCPNHQQHSRHKAPCIQWITKGQGIAVHGTSPSQGLAELRWESAQPRAPQD